MLVVFIQFVFGINKKYILWQCVALYSTFFITSACKGLLLGSRKEEGVFNAIKILLWLLAMSLLANNNMPEVYCSKCKEISPCVSWQCSRQLYRQRIWADLRVVSAEHSCSGFTSKQKSLASARLPECCYDSSYHKCCCKQLYSKSVLKQSKSQAAFESKLQGKFISD